MARAVTFKETISQVATEYSTGLGANSNTAQLVHAFEESVDWPSGTSDGQVDRTWSGTGTATTTPSSIDVIGSLSSAIGAGTTSFAEVVRLTIKNTASTGNLIVGGGATPFALFFSDDALYTAGATLQPGESLIFRSTTGRTAAAGVSDLIWLQSSAGSVSYSAYLVGRSA